MDNRNFSSVQYVPANPPQFQEKRRPVATSKSHLSGRKENESGLLFALRWTCLVLTVAATIVFGIWAPLSYKATVDANNDGNVAQSSVMSVASAANDLASSRIDIATHANSMASKANDIAKTANSYALHANKVADAALSIAFSQSSVLDAVQTRIAAMGQLWLVDFCASRTTLSACASYFETLNFNELASSLAEALPTNLAAATTPPPISDITEAPPSTTESLLSTSSLPSATSLQTGSPKASEGAARSSGIPVAAILGIVFGITGVLGALAGVVVWRYRQRRLS